MPTVYDPEYKYQHLVIEAVRQGGYERAIDHFLRAFRCLDRAGFDWVVARIERFLSVEHRVEFVGRLSADAGVCSIAALERRVTRWRGDLAVEEREVLESRALEAKLRQEALDGLRRRFHEDFLSARRFLNEKAAGRISEAEFLSERAEHVRTWRRHAARPNESDVGMDEQQASAAGWVDSDVIVVARAGSGKTATVINRALFLADRCRVSPDAMLLLAFNRSAAMEMRDRLESETGSSFPHVMTFHALAYAVVHPEKAILYDDPEGDPQKSRISQRLIDGLVRSEKWGPVVRRVMLDHFRSDWERIMEGGWDLPPDELIAFRRSLPREALDGRKYKSFGEKRIANLLFEHGVKYWYENNFWWNGINYRPDFVVPLGKDRAIVIEYFGLRGDPDYDEQTEAKVAYWQQRDGYTLIDLYPKDIASGDEGTGEIVARLVEAGVEMARLSEEEIWERVRDRAIDRCTEVLVNFVARCRKAWIEPAELDDMIAQSDDDETHGLFLSLASQTYRDYLGRIEATGEDDFDGLLQKAILALRCGKSSFERRSGRGDFRNLRFVFVDEYQDFTKLFDLFVAEIRRYAPNAKFFCVGDDWQAINGFAGSDLEYFDQFDKRLPGSSRLWISTNYRSKKKIVEVGNRVMFGHGEPARSAKDEGGVVFVGDLDLFEPTPEEQELSAGHPALPAVLRLVYPILRDGSKVRLLSRTNHLPWLTNDSSVPPGVGGLEAFLTSVRRRLPEDWGDRISISTAHKFKGGQRSTVIVLDATARRYPLVHPDIVFTRILGDTVRKQVDEERRLFYVALTRAVDALIVLTFGKEISPLLVEVSEEFEQIRWKGLELVPSDGAGVHVKAYRAYAVRQHLKSAGFKFNRSEKCWYRTFDNASFDAEHEFGDASWIGNAGDMEIVVTGGSTTGLTRLKVKDGRLVRQP